MRLLTDPFPGLIPVWQHDAGDTGDRQAVRVLRLWHRGRSRALVSDWFAVGGGERVEKIAHAQLAPLGFENVKAARNDRLERGRVERIERLKGIVRCRKEHGKVERNSKAQQADENKISHARLPPMPAQDGSGTPGQDALTACVRTGDGSGSRSRSAAASNAMKKTLRSTPMNTPTTPARRRCSMLGASVPIACCAAVPSAGVIRDAHRPSLVCREHKTCLIRQTITTNILVIANRSASRSLLARVF